MGMGIGMMSGGSGGHGRPAIAAWAAVVLAVCTWTVSSTAPAGEIGREMSPGAKPAEYDPSVFKSDPDYSDKPYDSERQLEIYGGKRAIDDPRPVFEIGRRQYVEGPFGATATPFGRKNELIPGLMVFGDWRTAIAYNDNGGKEQGLVATRLNLDIDLKLTATERIHAFVGPLDQNNKFTRCAFSADDDDTCELELDGNLETLFFEGDLGAITAGLTDEYVGFDLPFAAGLTPLLFQNGVWLEDAMTGFAVALPALNSPKLDISNMDFTFFAGFDKVTTAAMLDTNGKLADHSVNLYGVAAFLEVLGGYSELGIGYTDGEDGLDQFDYVNLTAAFTRRYGGWLSNSVRFVWNVGQDPDNNRQDTADGYIVLVENSLITHKPLTLIPYLNAWVGIDRPQSLARAAGAGGILKNTGINFETDGLTGFPKLDDTGRNTFGAALGIEYLFDLHQQIVAEVAVLQVIEGNNEAGRPAKGDQHGFAIRYQRPLTKAWIARVDTLHGGREFDDNISGMRFEIRRKF